MPEKGRINNAVGFKSFWYLIFVQLQVILLDFLMDSVLIAGLRRPEGPPEQRPIPIESGNLCIYMENQMVIHALHFSWWEWPVPWFAGASLSPVVSHLVLRSSLGKQAKFFSRAFCGSPRLRRHLSTLVQKTRRVWFWKNLFSYSFKCFGSIYIFARSWVLLFFFSFL